MLVRQELERVYRGHRRGLFGLALSITGSAAAAEDAVHDAFSRLFAQSNAPRGDLVPYVYAAVRHAAIDLQRRAAASVRLRAEVEPLFHRIYAGDDPGQNAAAAETRQRLAGAVQQLPPAQREAVLMHLFGGLTFQQIAEVLNEPLQTVASRYRRALQGLREALGVAHGNA